TPAYMSPEQVEQHRLTPASDWYSFGVMLFEALTGEHPFKGSLRDQVMAKLRETPPHASEVAGNAPRDLADLCALLLRREPSPRPTLGEVLSVLGEPEPPVVPPLLPDCFVGREREIATLRQAYAEACRGGVATAFVYGVSGIGKSALVGRFL